MCALGYVSRVGLGLGLGWVLSMGMAFRNGSDGVGGSTSGYLVVGV